MAEIFDKSKDKGDQQSDVSNHICPPHLNEVERYRPPKYSMLLAATPFEYLTWYSSTILKKMTKRPSNQAILAFPVNP